MNKIVVVDYGMGNLGSVLNMFKKVGASAQISADLETIAKAKKILLPGVIDIFKILLDRMFVPYGLHSNCHVHHLMCQLTPMRSTLHLKTK